MVVSLEKINSFSLIVSYLFKEILLIACHFILRLGNKPILVGSRIWLNFNSWFEMIIQSHLVTFKVLIFSIAINATPNPTGVERRGHPNMNREDGQKRLHTRTRERIRFNILTLYAHLAKVGMTACRCRYPSLNLTWGKWVWTHFLN